MLEDQLIEGYAGKLCDSAEGDLAKVGIEL